MRAHRTRAMGTWVEVLGPDDVTLRRASHVIETVFGREEERFSRFRGSSELTEVNRSAGSPTRVSAPFAQVLRLALDAAERTEGAFDPTVHDALVAAGYDRDFDEILAGARGALHRAEPCGRWADVEVRDDVILLPAGVHLDLGGLAKGWTADLAAETAVGEGAAWIVVNAGGDLRIAGDAPTIEVGVDDPFATDGELGRLQLREGAVATSSTMKRSWGAGIHHIIDPRTGAPSRGPLVQATVWAPTCAEAEVRATVSLVLGRSDPQRPNVVVDADGTARVATALEEAA